MEDIINDVDLEIEANIPEADHVVTILEGIGDSLADVGGTESLTSAQVYLGSVLVANGHIKRNQVGQEGFFSKIGEGAKAGLEYVKKMFRSIYEFFFKRDAPKLAADAKAAVKEGEEVIKAIETGGSSEAETDKALHNLRSVVLALTHQPDVNKTALDQILKEADEALKGSQADKKKAVLSIGRELPKLNKRSQVAIKKRVDAVIKDLERMEKAVDDIISKGSAAGAGAADKHMADGLKSQKGELTAVLGQYRKASQTQSIADLKDLYTVAIRDIEVTEKGYKALQDERTRLESYIKELESGKEENAKKHAKELGSLLASVVSMINASKSMLNSVGAMIKAGNKSFGY